MAKGPATGLCSFPEIELSDDWGHTPLNSLKVEITPKLLSINSINSKIPQIPGPRKNRFLNQKTPSFRRSAELTEAKRPASHAPSVAKRPATASVRLGRPAASGTAHAALTSKVETSVVKATLKKTPKTSESQDRLR